jgi:hypothetical protein
MTEGNMQCHELVDKSTNGREYIDQLGLQDIKFDALLQIRKRSYYTEDARNHREEE